VSTHPIMVGDGMSARQAIALVCTHCEWEGQASADQCSLVEIESPCPRCNRSLLDWKYADAEKCNNCGALDWTMPIDHRWCSRRCKLQGEYAAQIAEHTEAAR